MNHSELFKNPVGMSSCSSGSLLPSHDAFGDLQNENPDERELIPTGFFNNSLWFIQLFPDPKAVLD
jgi:hypothetical protein